MTGDTFPSSWVFRFVTKVKLLTEFISINQSLCEAILFIQTLQGILSPDKIELKGINPLKKLYEIQKEKLGGTPTPGTAQITP